jgi:hypothetical protein
MTRVRREDVDVTERHFNLATDSDGLEIEFTQRLTTVSGGVSDDRGGPLDATVVASADDPAREVRPPAAPTTKAGSRRSPVLNLATTRDQTALGSLLASRDAGPPNCLRRNS